MTKTATLSDTLSHAAAKSDLTAYRVAKLTGLHQQTVHRILTGRTETPAIGAVIAIAQAVGLPVPDWQKALIPAGKQGEKESGK